MTENKKVDYSILIVCFMGLLYFLLPTANSTLDSYSYAYSIREGIYLFRYHHLLYNVFPHIFTSFFNINNTLSFVCGMNALFAMLCLFITRLILLHYIDIKKTALYMFFLGSCFGFIRFATDGEAYILPLFIALCASYLALKKKDIFLISLVAAIACLFHQMFVFWWIGLYLFIFMEYKDKRVNYFLKYATAALIVPIVYVLVFYLTEHDTSNVIEYVFHDYIKNDSVNISFKKTTLLFIPANFIRTFVQVHGYFIPLLKQYLWLVIFSIAAILCFLLALLKIKNSILKISTLSTFDSRYALSHLITFLLHFIFACISDGNAEFMYMLPFLLIIWLIIKYNVNERLLLYFSLGLFTWNFMLGIVPSHFLQLNSNKALVDYMATNPTETYLVNDYNTTINLLEYHYPEKRIEVHKIELIDSLITNNNSFLTDAIGNDKFMSRANIIKGFNDSLELKYKSEIIESLKYDLGELKIVRLSK